ncbi:uncharacterized protein BT62DRAFT_931976 [Guyanagaster necrorhizus]|uniref:Uncharacterized protein n=1 Tax=Guyanagaster necrorhizus TaxID=856835 RepID=A0A9P8ASU9_9AGAR|nr:uncharacterized protein BT62DRAFT_931976 [Guyanagaster necrorhizus MCA 3950]KAG7446540.1 hypothetical protein BT62DRAFT_931976 [Guyanagaster necrorhizus MCA 3950]
MAPSASSEADKLRYSRELAAYTLRQFSAYTAHLSPDKVVAAKIPPEISARLQRIFQTSAKFSEQQKPSSVVV